MGEILCDMREHNANPLYREIRWHVRLAPSVLMALTKWGASTRSASSLASDRLHARPQAAAAVSKVDQPREAPTPIPCKAAPRESGEKEPAPRPTRKGSGAQSLSLRQVYDERSWQCHETLSDIRDWLLEEVEVVLGCARAFYTAPPNDRQQAFDDWISVVVLWKEWDGRLWKVPQRIEDAVQSQKAPLNRVNGLFFRRVPQARGASSKRVRPLWADALTAEQLIKDPAMTPAEFGLHRAREVGRQLLGLFEELEPLREDERTPDSIQGIKEVLFNAIANSEVAERGRAVRDLDAAVRRDFECEAKKHEIPVNWGSDSIKTRPDFGLEPDMLLEPFERRWPPLNEDDVHVAARELERDGLIELSKGWINPHGHGREETDVWRLSARGREQWLKMVQASDSPDKPPTDDAATRDDTGGSAAPKSVQDKSVSESTAALSGPAAAGDKDAEDSQETIDEADKMILAVLQKAHPERLSQEGIEDRSGRLYGERDQLGLRTIKHRLPKLESSGYVHRPEGPRRGYTITPQGARLLGPHPTG